MKKKQPHLFASKVVCIIFLIIGVPLLLGMTIGKEATKTEEPTLVEYRISLYSGGKEVEHWDTTNKIFHTDTIIDFKDQDGYDVHIRSTDYAIQRQR